MKRWLRNIIAVQVCLLSPSVRLLCCLENVRGCGRQSRADVHKIQRIPAHTDVLGNFFQPQKFQVHTWYAVYKVTAMYPMLLGFHIVFSNAWPALDDQHRKRTAVQPAPDAHLARLIVSLRIRVTACVNYRAVPASGDRRPTAWLAVDTRVVVLCG